MNRTLLIAIVAAVLTFFRAGAQQQSCSLRTFDIHDGLPSYSISAITQDPTGIIWVATWNGLCYYDGYSFTAFRGNYDDSPLSSTRLAAIETDSAGHVWVMTYDRNVYFLDTRTGRFNFVGDAMRSKAGRPIEARNIVATDTHLWVVGEKGSPSARLSIDKPLDPASIDIVDMADLPEGTSEVLKVEADTDGNEWLFTDRGVVLYGNTAVSADGPFAFQLFMGDGHTYLFTADGRPFSYARGESKLTPLEKPQEIKRLYRLIPFDNSVMLAATDNGVITYDTRNNRLSRLPADLPAGTSAVITDIFTDSRKRVWAFTERGDVILYPNDQTPGHVVSVNNDVKNVTRSTLPIWIEDRYGNVWLAPKDGPFGYYNISTGRIEPQALRSSRFNLSVIPTIEHSFVDRQNNLWLSSSHNLTAVCFFNDNFRKIPLIDNEEVRSIAALRNGDILMGTTYGVIGRFDADGNIKGYLAKSGPGRRSTLANSQTPKRFSIRVYAMHQDRDDNIWIGTKGDGLYTIDPNGVINHYLADPDDPYSIPCDTIYDFNEDNGGNLWIATYGSGLLLARKGADGTHRFVGPRNEMKQYPADVFHRVRRITNTKDGTIIASCTNGLLTFSNKDAANPEKLRFFTSRHSHDDPESLATDNIMQALVASDGTVYVLPLGKGVQRVISEDLLQSGLKFGSVNQGSTPNSVLNSFSNFGNALSLVEDKNGNIDVIFESTVVTYDPRTGDSYTLAARSLDTDIEFTEAKPAVFAPTSEVWLGSIGGGVLTKPDNVVASNVVPKIVVTGVQFQGEAERRITIDPECIVLPADVRNVAIGFSALDYPESSNIRYAYRFDKEADWTFIDGANTIYLNSLKPGIHRLYIRSTNSDGVWQDNTTPVDIMVEPNFGESAFATILRMLAIAAGIMFFVYLFMLYRRNQMMKDLHRKEHDFFITASHSLRTPLTLIGGPVGEVLKTEQLTPTGREHLERVNRNAHAMLDLVNSMLESGFKGTDAVDDSNAHYITPIAQAEAGAQSPDAQKDAAKKDITILIVEDNSDLREFLVDILSGKYNVVEAANGKEGLKKAAEVQPDFIITDVMMPEMDGLTMVRNIKRTPQLSHIPIIVLSAKASLEDRIQGLSEGIDDYITKPFSATYLRQRISSIITQRRSLQQAFFEQIRHEMNASAPAVDGETAATAPAGEQPVQPREEYRLDAPKITDADQEMMNSLLKYIETRIADENLKIEELADAVNMGRTVFYGKIKSLVGMSPSDFVRKLRMQRAEELIARSKMNFSQIAYNVGFSDPKYFTKCFKRETGMTPSEYRQKALSNNQITETPDAD